MKADTLTLKDLFHKEVRYLIPTFQRPYVWNQDDQWEPLWDDVQAVADRYSDALIAAGGDAAVAEKLTKAHFLGAVVVQLRHTAAKDLETREVIDGQQRLTTLQLLIDAAQEVAENMDFTDQATSLNRLVVNAFANGDDRYKLWPSALDREAFVAAMTNGAPVDEVRESPLVAAHEFFKSVMADWLGSDGTAEGAARRIGALETVLYGLLEVVVIDLGFDDDPFVIFETLNARGTPLLASDLVKNFTLQQAENAGEAADRIHDEYWEPLADPWWREEVRQGRLRRPRIDVLLNYWVSMRRCDDVSSQRVFAEYKELAEQAMVANADLVSDLSRTASIYKSLEAVDANTRLGTFVYRWRVMDAGSISPLVLWLLSEAKVAMSEADALACLSMVEAVLVRRMICRRTSKAYNRASIGLLKELMASEPEDRVGAVAAHFAKAQGDSWRCPADDEVRDAILGLPLYRLLTRSRLRMLLEAFEDHLRSGYAEADHVLKAKLQIEHIMPQGWQHHWPLPSVEDDEVERANRNRIVHTLGNLTLVHEALNQRLSNDPWTVKQSLVSANTVLRINADLVTRFGDTDWNEASIGHRGLELSDAICAVWPMPSA